MFRELGLPAWLLIYAAAIPVAVLIGMSAANPTSFGSLAMIAMVVGTLTLPLVLRYHHDLLILTWSSALVVFFLPGRPALALMLAGFSFMMAVLSRVMTGKPMLLPARTVVVPLIVLLVVVFATAMMRGGVGGKAFGAEMYGARRYAGVMFAVLGFLALISREIPRERAGLLMAFFLLSATSSALSDVAYALNMDYLFLLFSTDVAFLQAVSEQVGSFVRFTGICWAAWAVFNYLLMRYGIGGLLDFSRPWRMAFALIAFGATMVGGYRSYIVLTAMLFTVLFFLEGLYRTKVLPMMLLITSLMVAAIVPNVRLLPLAIQRSLSILPLDIDPVARHDAQGTLDWRFEMWKTVLPEVPKYLLLGKGFSYSGTDYYLTQEAYRRGMLRLSYEDTLVSGNYHQGLLTLVIPFGIWGVMAFGWFCWMALRALFRNLQFGDPRLLNVNRYLLAAFVTRLVFYLTIYGQFDLDLAIFTGFLGMSIALNGGILSPARAREREKAATPVQSVPALVAGPRPNPAHG